MARPTKLTRNSGLTATERIRFDFQPTPKQWPFAASSAIYKLGGGARGGGKTKILSGMAVALSLDYPGNRGFAGRRDMDAFRDTTLKEILETIPRGLCVEPCPHKQEKFIRIRTRKSIETGDDIWDSVILYGELKDAGSILSGNLGWFLIDEAYEAPLLSFMHLSGSIGRHILPDGTKPPAHGLLASNPSPGWLMDLFPVLENEYEYYNELTEQYGTLWRPQPTPNNILFPEKTIDFDYSYFPFRAHDNPYLDEAYLNNLEKTYRHDPVLYARFVLGRWDMSMSGLVYSLLPIHRWNPKQPGDTLYMPNEPVLLGIDPSNGAGNYAATVWQVKGHRKMQVAEYKVKEATNDDFIDWLHQQPFANDIVDAVGDSARPDTITQLRRMGVPARHVGKKDITSGINAFKGIMRVDPVTQQSDYVIDETACPQTVREFGMYSWKQTQLGGVTPEQPKKEFDDLMDANRYLVETKWPTSDSFGDEGEYRKAGGRSPVYLVRGNLRRG